MSTVPKKQPNHIDLPEPPDGSQLVIRNLGGDLAVIRRDDAEAARWDPEMWEINAGDRWFDETTAPPSSWKSFTAGATDVYTLAPYTPSGKDTS